MQNLTWVEISREALANNVKQFRGLVGPDVLLCTCVKGNAYGHGLVEAGKIFIESGVDWLCVYSLYEAVKLRENGITAPIYILGYVALADLEEVVKLDLRLVVFDVETIERLGKNGGPVKVHIKVETGNNRQGVLMEDLVSFAQTIAQFPNIEIEGISTHFANIEDTTDHTYADSQLAKFEEAGRILTESGFKIPLKHCANSAATILFKKTHFEMVRVGISGYGMWPSNETYVSFLKEKGGEFELKPALTWKVKIGQIKTIGAGEYIGYGCTYRASHETKLAILPVGYYDGYDRGISNGYVLIHGKRAPIRGRVCMNIIMVEVTDIPEAKLEDEVVLIGKSGDEEITAEQFAVWASTISWEVVTRINERTARVVV